MIRKVGRKAAQKVAEQITERVADKIADTVLKQGKRALRRHTSGLLRKLV